MVASRIIVKRAAQIPPAVRASVIETLDACIFAAVLSLIIITFVVQAFYSPSGSMEPTLLVDDRILVAKFLYRFEPVARADVIVFRYPLNPSRDFVKRVIGLPGQRVQLKDGVVYVDGDLDLSGWNSTGYGLLVVTGELRYDPSASWYGVVLVAGEGNITSLSAASGSGEIRGALFLARTLDVANNPLPPLGPLGPTSFNFNTAPSSGGVGISYSSCWIKAALPKSGYKKLSFREIIPQ